MAYRFAAYDNTREWINLWKQCPSHLSWLPSHSGISSRRATCNGRPDRAATDRATPASGPRTGHVKEARPGPGGLGQCREVDVGRTQEVAQLMFAQAEQLATDEVAAD